MILLEHLNGPGSADGPVAPDNYKRAVYRPPPTRFTVEMLTPAKQGGSYAFGMRINPVLKGDRSSISSRGSDTAEYEIWRRWEDCLWFQEMLEVEYERMARSKRQRLIAGKGVRRNGFYKQDAASSWESLPPGPDPHSVAQSIHKYVPKLTKKGTLFRASQSTIDQRHKELESFVTGLFAEDVPMLIKELRMDRIVTDFFGYWRRDHDLALKSAKNKDRSSVTSSMFSSYFSEAGPISPISPMSSPPRARAPSSASLASPVLYQNHPTHHVPRPRTSSSASASSESSSTPSSRSSIGSLGSSVPTVIEDVPVIFENPYDHQHPGIGLQALPEDAELSPFVRESSLVRQPRVSLDEKKRNKAHHRSTQVFGLPNHLAVLDDERNVRESWATTASAATYLEDLGITLSNSYDPQYPRNSIASVATCMTTDSAEAVVGRSRSVIAEVAAPPTSRYSLASTYRMMSDIDDDIDEKEDAFASFPVPRFHLPSTFPHPRSGDIKGNSSPPLGDRSPTPSNTTATITPPITPVAPSHSPNSLAFPTRSSNAGPRPPTPSRLTTIREGMGNLRASSSTPLPPSPVSDIFSATSETFSSAPSSKGSLTVKAAHNNSIIILRVPRDILFSELRKRIHQKFVTQEDIPLSDSYTLAIVLNATPKSPTHTRNDSNESNATQMSISAFQMNLLLGQNDWDRALSTTEGNKITLRVLETMS